MNRTSATALLTVSVLLGVSSTASAHDRWHGHHSGSHFGFYFGAPLFWAPYPYYYQYPRTVVVEPPPVYVQQAPPVYVQQPRAYWYYCPNPAGYYPTVGSCPTGWMPVLPRR